MQSAVGLVATSLAATGMLGPASAAGGEMLFAGASSLIFAFVVSVILTPVVRDLARRWRVVDAIGSLRRVHKVPTARGGGLAVLVACSAAVAAVVLGEPELRARFLGHEGGRIAVLMFFAGGAVITLTGLADDVRGLRARHKLVAQIIVAFATCSAGFVVEDVALPAGIVVHLGALGMPLTILWMVGVMNAVNLIDGLDGLAAGVAAIALVAILAFAVMLGQPVVAVIAAALLGALGGFLVYNFNPASVFMGDTGSLLVGYCLSVLSLLAARLPGTKVVEAWVPLVVLAVPLTDTTLAMARRALRGRPLFSPDRGHLHHRLLAMGLTQRRAVLVLYVAGALLAAAAVVMRLGSPLVAILTAAGLVAAALVGLRRLGMLEVKLTGLAEARRRNLGLQARLHGAAVRLRTVSTTPALNEAAAMIAQAAGAVHARVRVGPVGPRPQPTGTSDILRVRFLLCDGPVCVGDLELTWLDGRDHLHRDEALAIEELCEELGRAATRVYRNANAAAASTAARGAMARVAGGAVGHVGGGSGGHAAGGSAGRDGGDAAAHVAAKSAPHLVSKSAAPVQPSAD